MNFKYEFLNMILFKYEFALIFLPFIKKKTRSLSLSQARLFEAKNKWKIIGRFIFH